DGCRTLVFSNTKRALDVIQVVLRERRVKFVRIDGDMSNIDERRRIVTRFNCEPSISVFLLTTGVGALGLTLTSANRVIIFDPSWNPAIETQAVDRAYRVGQTQDVITYRLIAAGTVEEKMYGLQVFKSGLTSDVMADASCGVHAKAGDVGGTVAGAYKLALPMFCARYGALVRACKRRLHRDSMRA
ncbi:DEAD/DEAH box helicase, partial [archaeon]